MLRDITVVLAVPPADALKLTYMENFAAEVRLVARGAGDNTVVPLNPVGPEQYPVAR